MAHLYKFRQGWQSENLSRYLLSQISFIAQPSTIADDVGSDFYCTLFQKVKAGRNHHLVPKNAFVIQIKSNTSPIILTSKAAFLYQLELPFFIGVADRKNLRLRIYSGRGLDIVFPMHGIPRELTAKVSKPMKDLLYYDFPKGDRTHTRLKFPLVAEIKVKDTDANLERTSTVLANECALIHGNISARRVGEFIIDLGRNDLRMVAGQGSATVFRGNVARRFAEAFINLHWIKTNQPSSFSIDEYLAYEAAWNAVRNYAPKKERDWVDWIYRTHPIT